MAAGDLHSYFGRAAVDLTDTEVWLWMHARIAANKAVERESKPGVVEGNINYKGP